MTKQRIKQIFESGQTAIQDGNKQIKPVFRGGELVGYRVWGQKNTSAASCNMILKSGEF